MRGEGSALQVALWYIDERYGDAISRNRAHNTRCVEGIFVGRGKPNVSSRNRVHNTRYVEGVVHIFLSDGEDVAIPYSALFPELVHEGLVDLRVEEETGGYTMFFP